MISIEIETAQKTLSDYVKNLGDEPILLTSDKKPFAAIVSLKNSDEESIALSNNQEFMNIIKNARQEFKDGKKISFEKIKQEFS